MFAGKVSFKEVTCLKNTGNLACGCLIGPFATHAIKLSGKFLIYFIMYLRLDIKGHYLKLCTRRMSDIEFFYVRT